MKLKINTPAVGKIHTQFQFLDIFTFFELGACSGRTDEQTRTGKTRNVHISTAT